MSQFNPHSVRQQVPGLQRIINGRPITYLDSAASSLPPQLVIDAMSKYYEQHHANVHRAVYTTAVEATEAYEHARVAVAQFIHAKHANEIIFTKNTTESFNLIARSWGKANLTSHDAIVLSEMEHHANIVPWFQLRDEIGFEIRFLGTTDDFRLDLHNYETLVQGAKLVSVTGMSNVLGTINPIKEMVAIAHRHDALFALDGAQSVAHLPVDVQDLDVDFLAFSGHKMLGPTGIGVLWTRGDIANAMPPFLGGGGMISDVSLDGFLSAESPAKFEAGTPPIAEAVGLGAAVSYLENLGMNNISAHEQELTIDALARLRDHFGGRVRIIGPADAESRGGVLSLDVEGVHPHDVAQILDQFGVCIRPGHHCAKPLMKRFGLAATARASFGPYSLTSDTDVLLEALERAISLFG